VSNVVSINQKKEEPTYPIEISFVIGSSVIYENHNVGESEDLSGFLVVANKDSDEIEYFYNKDLIKSIRIITTEKENDDFSETGC
jgi:hypothetical protein